MRKQSNRKKFNQFNRQRAIDAAGALWYLAANSQNPDAVRVLAKMVGLDKIALLLILKAAGHRTIDAEAVAAIAGAIERMPKRWRR
jgi:hypothetical protein